MTTPRAHILSVPQWAIDLGLMLAVGVFFGFLGPFGSDRASLSLRLMYWITVMPAGGVCVILAEHGVRWIRPHLRSAVGQVILVAALAALPQSIIVLICERVIFGLTYNDFASVWSQASALAGLYGSVILVMLAMVPLIRLVRAYIRTRAHNGSAPRRTMDEPTPTRSERPVFLDRLDGPAAAETILALQAEDHYVRVHLPQGSQLVLIRLADAMAEMVPVEGYQTHRSWWVAKAAIQSGEFKRGTGRILLTTGLQAPVSRTHAPALRDAGVLPSHR
ncbi:LytTR family DNA-binding domain-containing protein [Maricaulis sp. D1M11]|uniref:LytTR family DNA-binding domain-containing protein n=1 Tax=Maricaulis sp. D1M11 TaxID=3076117 RepID=UPI0039B53B7C